MAFITLRQLLDHAAEHGYGVPAFNVNNLEQIQAIMEAAEETRSPVILQASAGARKYAGEAYLRHLLLAAVETHPDIPVVLHRTSASPSVCLQSMRSGFTSVMMDGSLQEDAKTPASYDYNVDVTRGVCDMAHAVGVSVEGELGCLGSLEEIQRGIKSGVRKINIDTDIRLAMTGAMRQAFAKDPSEFDPRKAFIAARKAARSMCKARFEAFGCAGHADRIKPLAMDAMVKRYL